MDIFLLIQDEPFYLAKELPSLLKEHKVVGVSLLSQKLPKDNFVKFVWRYLCLFGFYHFNLLALKTLVLRLNPSHSLQSLFKQNNIPIIKTKNINDSNFIKKIKDLKADLLVSIACPQIISNKLLAQFPKGGINLHGGYLPDFAGVFTPFWNLLKQSQFAGCTVHQITNQIDGGPILARTQFNICATDTMMSLYQKITACGIPLLVETIHAINKQAITSVPNPLHLQQYHSFPTWRDGASFRKANLRYF